MTKRDIYIFGIAFIVLQSLISCKFFVTYSDMAAYAVSKDSMQMIITRLDAMDHKLDILMGERNK
jgi:hypothetical protein